MIELLKSLSIHQYDCELIDIRIEETNPIQISFFQKMFLNYNEEKKIGAFIRVFSKNKWYYVATTELKNLESELHNLLISAGVSTIQDKNKQIVYSETHHDLLGQRSDYAYRQSKEDKIAFLAEVRKEFENDNLVLNPYVAWKDNVLHKYFINNQGIVYSYNKAFSGIRASYSLKENDSIFDTYFLKVARFTNEFDSYVEEFRADFAEAKLFINAPTIKPGKYVTVLSPQATGIFAHESFGHKSEADFMIGDETMALEWEIGKKVASDMVSIIDSGAEETNSGYCPFDDEGNPSKKTYLIKDGILTGRLHSKKTATILKEENTSNARAINFEWEPIVRMRNTYVKKGDLTFEEMIKPIEFGYFIKTTKHGSGMSTFTIAPSRSYKIENGKLTDPVKINIATGTVFQTLFDIDGVGDTLEIQSQVFGGCGKQYQSPLDVSFGGPHIRIKSLNLS
ncbi:MAG: TldD/PmbA family protein [Candidatus Cloacimonetes bacterium]|nr:TldD/PmbA family protein [Candidatus Cloacimonadota bacterium]